MSDDVEIGSVGRWRYFIRPIAGGRRFEVLRRDLPEDRLEDVLDETETEQEARAHAQAAISRRRCELNRKSHKVQQGERSGPHLLTVNKAAECLGVSTSTLYGWVWQRRIPFVKLGRSLRFDQAELEKFVDSHRTPACR
jgi:excisionase family DNA binding protein